MRAVVLEAPRQARVRDLPTPQLGDADVLVAVERVGVCGSDLAVFQGTRRVHYPLVMGHEAVGRILDPGTSQHTTGSPVVIEPNIPCGRCDSCRRGFGNACPDKRSLGMNWPGAFAEAVAVPAAFAHPLPRGVRRDDALGIEPLAVAVHAVGAARVAQGETVSVLGCGAEGLLLIQVAVACGARVIAADLSPERLELARRLGAKRVVVVPTDPSPSIDRRLRAPVVFEAAGSAPAVELALRVVAPGGRVVALGLGSAAARLVPLQFVRRGLTLIGSIIYDHPTDFERAIELVSQQRIRPAALVSQVVDGLDALPAAMATLVAGAPPGKTVVAIGDGA